jgi:putative ABC transport system substrate-binding protein
MIRRRTFITLLGGAAAAWPVAAKAQQAGMPVVGYLHYGFPEPNGNFTNAFRDGLREAGFVEGQNVFIEYRWAENDIARLPELATDLIQRRVSVIATPFYSAAILAAKAATSTIPIVFSTGADPVQLGVVASLNRPGGNITGVTYMSVELVAKRFGLLHELLPAATRFAILVNPNSPLSATLTRNAQGAASAIGQHIEVLDASTNDDIDAAFAKLVRMRIEGLMVAPDSLFSDRRVQIAILSARHAVPTVYPFRADAEAGGLMSYGGSIPAEYHDVGFYVGRILKGENPAGLPVMRPTKLELVINIRTAKALNVIIPAPLLASADQVIE